MSSPPHTPTKSQVKKTLAVEDQNITPKAQATQQPKEQSSLDAIVPPQVQPVATSKQEVQVPSSMPPPKKTPVSGTALDLRSQTQGQALRPNKFENEIEEEGKGEDEDEIDDTASDSDLAPFDMKDFQERYEEGLSKINEDEDNLIKEFDKLSEVPPSLSILIPSISVSYIWHIEVILILGASIRYERFGEGEKTVSSSRI